MTKVFSKNDNDFYDDYAHHPTEISSILEGVHNVNPDRKIISIFEPHRYSRVLSLKKEFSKENYITTSYENYKQRVKSTYKLLDSINGDNIYRIYPEKLFCNTLIKGRCLTHDSKNLFYSDEHHPSLYIIEQLANQTIQKINFIFN